MAVDPGLSLPVTPEPAQPTRIVVAGHFAHCPSRAADTTSSSTQLPRSRIADMSHLRHENRLVARFLSLVEVLTIPRWLTELVTMGVS